MSGKITELGHEILERVAKNDEDPRAVISEIQEREEIPLNEQEGEDDEDEEDEEEEEGEDEEDDDEDEDDE